MLTTKSPAAKITPTVFFLNIKISPQNAFTLSKTQVPINNRPCDQYRINKCRFCQQKYVLCPLEAGTGRPVCLPWPAVIPAQAGIQNV
jgi:hypothetical protein